MNPTWLYVGVLFFAGIAILRRTPLRVPWRIATFFYLLVLIFFFRPMTQDYVNVPADFLGTLPPWSRVMPSHVANRESNDVILQMVPWAHVVREQWKSFRLPLWNPYSGAGSILLANGQSAALSPLRLLTLPLSLTHVFTAEAALKLLIGLVLTFVFCRRRGYSELASAAGAIAFGFSMFLICWLHFPHATVAVLLPAAVLHTELLAEAVTRKRIAFGALVWGAILLGGHPETASHIFFFVVLMVIWIVAVLRPFTSRRDTIRYLGALVAAWTLAALIASPFLISFAESVRKSLRYQQLQIESKKVLFVDPYSLMVVLQPHFFGPNEQGAWGPWWAGAETVSGFAGSIGLAGWIALLIETVRTRRWRSWTGFFVVATPILLGIIFNWPFIGGAFHAVFAMAANARVRLLLCFVVAVQTAGAVDMAERGRNRALLIALLVVSVILAFVLVTTPYPNEWARDWTILAMLPTLGAIAAATWMATATRRRHLAAMIAVVAITYELWVAGGYWYPVLEAKRVFPPTPLTRRLQELTNRSNPPSRIVGLEGTLFPNGSALYGLRDIRTHDPMANGRYLGILRSLTGYSANEYFAQWKNTATPLLDYLNVRYVVADRGKEVTDAKYQLVYHGRDGRIYENRDVLPRFFAARNVILEFRKKQFNEQLLAHTGWRNTAIVDTLPVENDLMRQDLLRPRPPHSAEATVQLTRATETSFSMKVRAPRYTLVVSSHPYWPGWRVRQNGKRILTRPVNGAFLGFTVPKGEWDIEVDYFPAHIYTTFALSLLTVMACAGMMVSPSPGLRPPSPR